MKKRGSKTSSFGVKSRESHDASKFYERNLYHDLAEEKVWDGTEVPVREVNVVYTKDSRCMDELPDNSVHLMITSPPYNVGKEYDEDLSLDEYRQLLRDVFAETYRKLVPGGRACINVANVGRKPYIPLHAYIIQDMLDIGYLMRGEIIWDKEASAGASCAWGSWQSASNPTLRDVHEYILVFSKGQYKRNKGDKEDTIERDQFLEYTLSIWRFPTVSARQIGHPAPFPLELPARLIQLYSFAGDIVLDPFCGSGQTCIAALEAGRYYIGYDISPEYTKLAKERIALHLRQRNQRTLWDD
ncbi:MAG TPA: site-specific DNA-methyltransferase [Firmicutes bacterium]|nr:site-specific DNA-methyltransferase [Bacillota bacterium]